MTFGLISFGDDFVASSLDTNHGRPEKVDRVLKKLVVSGCLHGSNRLASRWDGQPVDWPLTAIETGLLVVRSTVC